MSRRSLRVPSLRARRALSQGGVRRRTTGATDEPSKGLATIGPAWIGAIAALLTAVVGALALWGFGADRANAQVEVDDASRQESALVVTGTYLGLEPDNQTVVVLLRPRDSADDPWATLEAERRPSEGSDDADSGTWTVEIPVGSAAYEVTAVIVPARRGGGFETSVLDELRDAGPDAEMVEASSDLLTVDRE